MPEHSDFSSQEFAPWQRGAAFNTYWSYTFVNNSVFYATIPLYLRPYYRRFVQRPLWWIDGWDPYFHSQDSGVLSTRLGGAIAERVARLVTGSRIMFKNRGLLDHAEAEKEAKEFMYQWAQRTRFERNIKRTIKLASDAGFALLKVNKNLEGDLWIEGLRADRFWPAVDASTGRVREVECWLQTTLETIPGTEKTKEDNMSSAYILVEHRYFGDFKRADGTTLHNAPLVEYYVKRGIGSITLGQFIMPEGGKAERILWKNLPKNIKHGILENYGTTEFDKPFLLPFSDWLGCEIVPWTDGVQGIPQLPFGESIILKSIPFLQLYDYITSVYGTELYLGRGRVLIPQGLDSGKTADGIMGNWDTGLDDMMFIKLPFMKPEDQEPKPVQFELRAEMLGKMKNQILESISVQIGISPGSLAPFLSDNSARTAREISTEENMTTTYVAETRSVIEKPINTVLARICEYYGLKEKVSIRWSQSGLSNPYMTTEMMVAAFSAGLVSLPEAISQLNPDDDDEQIANKVMQARKDWQDKVLGGQILNDNGGNYYAAAQFKPTSNIT